MAYKAIDIVKPTGIYYACRLKVQEARMSPVETAEFRTTAVMLRADQIVAIDKVKARMQQAAPGRVVSRSDVIRKALDTALPILSERAGQAEASV
jgi:hypothetical protein